MIELIVTLPDGHLKESMLGLTYGGAPIIRLRRLPQWAFWTLLIDLQTSDTRYWPLTGREYVTRSVRQKSLQLREVVRWYALGLPIRSAERALKLFSDVGNHIAGNTVREWVELKDSCPTYRRKFSCGSSDDISASERLARELSKHIQTSLASSFSQHLKRPRAT